jgi:hypothetical protein
MCFTNKINNVINFFINIKNIFIEKSLYYFNKNNKKNKNDKNEQNLNYLIYQYLTNLSEQFKNNNIIEAKMNEIKDLISNVSDQEILYEWENKYDHQLFISFSIFLNSSFHAK